MVQPSKQSLAAGRKKLPSPTSYGNDMHHMRSIFSTLGLVLLVGLIFALAGLVLDKHDSRTSPQLQSSTTSTTTNNMESLRVGTKQVTVKNDSNAISHAPTKGYFTLVSMNVAGCVPSRMAPESWTQKDSIEAVRAEIISHRPDWIALQEAPGGVELVDQVFGPDGYKAIGATYSHADQVVLLVRNETKATLIPLPGLPVIMAELELDGAETIDDPRRILVASVHLEPFEQGNRKRADQMKAIVQEAAALSLPVVIAGDMNMRQTEDKVMEKDLRLVDVWKLAGKNLSTKFTWDTMDYRTANITEEDSEKKGGYFNQYYGQSTRQYTARYDRIYIHRAKRTIDIVATDDSSPVTFDLIANKPMTSKLDFLSDHFGVVSILPIQWNR